MSTPPDEFMDVFVDGYDEDASYFLTIVDATGELILVTPTMPQNLPPGQVALEFPGSPEGKMWMPDTRTMVPQPEMPPPGVPSNEDQIMAAFEARIAGLRLTDLVDVDIDDANLEDGYTLVWDATEKKWRAGSST